MRGGMTQKDINESEWSDPRNWRGGFLNVYVSRKDTRLFVPKRRRFLGFTVNLGHPGGRWVLAAIAVFILGAILLTKGRGGFQ